MALKKDSSEINSAPELGIWIKEKAHGNGYGSDHRHDKMGKSKY